MSAASDPRVSDLLTVLAVQRTGSLTSAARELGVTPSQVSKSIARLERHCGTKLLSRGARGVTVSEAGQRLIPHLASAVDALRASRANDAGTQRIKLSVAGPSYLIAFLLPKLAQCERQLRLRGLELAPAYVRAYFTENVFDVAIVPGRVEPIPSGWTSDAVGRLRVALLGSPAIAKSLGASPASPDRVRELPFVGPMSTAGDRFVALADDCPLPMSERRIEHQAQTIGAALELAAQTGEYVVFGPIVAARHLMREKKLVEIPVEGWDVSEPVSVLCNGDAVLARVRRAIVATTRAALDTTS